MGKCIRSHLDAEKSSPTPAVLGPAASASAAAAMSELVQISGTRSKHDGKIGWQSAKTMKEVHIIGGDVMLVNSTCLKQVTPPEDSHVKIRRVRKAIGGEREEPVQVVPVAESSSEYESYSYDDDSEDCQAGAAAAPAAKKSSADKTHNKISHPVEKKKPQPGKKSSADKTHDKKSHPDDKKRPAEQDDKNHKRRHKNPEVPAGQERAADRGGEEAAAASSAAPAATAWRSVPRHPGKPEASLTLCLFAHYQES